MKPRRRHAWVDAVEPARRIQLRLAARVRLEPFEKKRALIVGLDVSYSRRSPVLWAGAVVVKWPELETVEEVVSSSRALFPYVPTYLSFREIPACIKALAKLKRKPDCIMCDGQGLAHPRFFGLAVHVGYLFDAPTVGCAKSRLVGEYREPGPKRGSKTALCVRGRPVGAVVRTRTGVRPLFVSPGYRMDVPSAVRLVLSTTAGLRLPEPIRRAHALVNRARQAALEADESSVPDITGPL